MHTAQIIILTILSILITVSYFGTALAKSDKKRMSFIILWLFTSAFTMIIAIIMTIQREDLLKEKDKCPQYEKIENVYQLKNKCYENN